MKERKESFLEIYGAREHNLKNIDLKIPLNKWTVITGLSGSGKSSLAFNTIFAEGQRRFLETFSGYVRQFLGTLERPDADKIEHLPPVIAIEQKTVSRNPRSTVGTVTEIYDLLRLLYAKIGKPSGSDGAPIRNMDTEQIVSLIVERFQGQKITVLAPLIRGRKGHYKELFKKLISRRYMQVRIDGEVRDLEPGMQLERYKMHDIEVVIDRLTVFETKEKRLRNAVEIALKEGEGSLMIIDKRNEIHYFNRYYTHPDSGFALPEAEPHLFSFNSPKGYCPVCKGLGTVWEPDLKKIIPDSSKSIRRGGLAPVDTSRHDWIVSQLEMILRHHGLSLDTPIRDIPESVLNRILYGVKDLMRFHSEITGVSHEQFVDFEGIVPLIKRKFEQAPYHSLKRWASQFMTEKICHKCQGTRLRQEALVFEIQGKNIAEISKMEISELDKWIKSLENSLEGRDKIIGSEILKEIKRRIRFLLNVGLDYLSLDRTSGSLSGGESQRIRLASQIGAGLVNVLYILDEPSIGLHASDNEKLIQSLQALRDEGNSIIVVEHDKEMMLAADHIVDLGPGAGREGGRVVAQGTPGQIMKAETETGRFLSGKKRIPVPEKRRQGTGKTLILHGASGHNLKNVNLHIPLGKLIVVTGVSGSGKSTLINETLYRALRGLLHHANEEALPYERLEGTEYIDKVINIDQSPIGRTPRSNPATYTGVFTDIRQLFAQTIESKIRGYKPGRFSFNVKGGRCPVCEGAGVRTIEMNFLPDVYITCEACQGKRFNRETLEVRYKGKNIYDVLEMSVNEAVEFFSHIPSIKRKLTILKEIGLGYLKLGQPSTTLSGGEAQRIKLASELAKRDTGKTLYILDEPTTGLHFEDIRMLMEILNKLVDKGNTVIIIEHNTDVIKLADHIIDMGPKGGAAGGKIIFEGTPEELIVQKDNLTGKYLKNEF